MKPWKRYLVLFLALLLILKVFSCHLVDYDSIMTKKTCRPMAESAEISKAETEQFLSLWAEYLERGLNVDVSDKISLLSGDIDTALPWHVTFWLTQNCWTASRFYYVEQRLRSIIHTLYLQEHTRAVKEILKNLLHNETDEVKKNSYQNMIEVQDLIANIEAVSPQELQMIEGRAQQVEDVLNGKMSYKEFQKLTAK